MNSRLIVLILSLGTLLVGCGEHPSEKARKMIEMEMFSEAREYLDDRLRENPADYKLHLWAGNATVMEVFNRYNGNQLDFVEDVGLLESASNHYQAAQKCEPSELRPLLNRLLLYVAIAWEAVGGSRRLENSIDAGGRDARRLADNIDAGNHALIAEAANLMRQLPDMFPDDAVSLLPLWSMLGDKPPKEAHKRFVEYIRAWSGGAWAGDPLRDLNGDDLNSYLLYVFPDEVPECLPRGATTYGIAGDGGEDWIVTVTKTNTKKGYVGKIISVLGKNPKPGRSVPSNYIVFEDKSLKKKVPRQGQGRVIGAVFEEDYMWIPFSQKYVRVTYTVAYDVDCGVAKDVAVLRPSGWPLEFYRYMETWFKSSDGSHEYLSRGERERIINGDVYDGMPMCLALMALDDLPTDQRSLELSEDGGIVLTLAREHGEETTRYVFVDGILLASSKSPEIG